MIWALAKRRLHTENSNLILASFGQKKVKKKKKRLTVIM